MITQLIHQIKQCEKKSQLEEFIHSLKDYDLEKIKQYSLQDEVLELATLVREKISELVLSNGDVGDSDYLYVYIIFASLDSIPQEPRLHSFIQTAQTYFLADGIGEYENLMLLELEVLCLILQGQSKEAMKRYIQGISYIEIHLSSVGKASEFIRSSFPKMGISMEFFLESMKEILQKESYMQLPFVRRRSILNWQLHCFWNVPTFFNHRLWLELYPLWRELFYAHMQDKSLDGLDHFMYMQFFIYHMCGNSYETQEQWKKFCEEIDKPACEVYAHFAKEQNLACLPAQKSQKKRVIGILRDRLVENSPYKVEYSFLKQILNNSEFKQNYTIKLYVMNLLEKSENSQSVIKSYEGLGIEVVDVVSEYNQKGFYNSHLQKALALNAKIKQDNVCYLISPNNGYGISDFVLSARSAPYQIFWSHGNFVYDIPNLDSRITHICGNEARVQREGFEFVGIPTVMDTHFYNPFVPEELIVSHRARFPKNAMILGTIGRLVKINSLPYLQIVVRIMKEFPQSIYLACGSGNIQEIEEKLKKILGEEYKEFMQRFYFCGYVNSAIYGHIIDFWLDSFPMEQGESRIEYVAKGKLSLVLAKNPSIVKKEWITMAINKEDYYQKALYLLSLTQEQRDEIIASNMAGLARYNHSREEMGIQNFTAFLEGLCKHF